MKGEKFYRPEKYGYTGKIFEEDFVGSIKKSSDYQKALFELKEKTKKGDYVGYNDALELAKKFQPWDPANPNKNFALAGLPQPPETDTGSSIHGSTDEDTGHAGSGGR